MKSIPTNDVATLAGTGHGVGQYHAEGSRYDTTTATAIIVAIRPALSSSPQSALPTNDASPRGRWGS